MKSLLRMLPVLAGTWLMATAQAQNTLGDMEVLTVNEGVTTIITAGEPVRFVDISTDRVAGDRPMDNTVRLKPVEGAQDGDILAIATIVTERYRVQYGLVYTSRMYEAVSDKEIGSEEVHPYRHPSVTMSEEEMYGYARRIARSPAMYRDVSYRKHGVTIRLNNIYSIGDYLFLDYSISNRTNIRFDIDEIRVSLQDKRIARATNTQRVELQPALVLDNTHSFKRGHRNVIVLKKMTFPNDKVLTIEITEKQISGRTLALSIDYEDVLSADSFNDRLLDRQ